MRLSSLAAISLTFLAVPASASPTPMGTVAAALKAPDRRPDNVKLDEGRKPAAVLQYLGLAPGMKVSVREPGSGPRGVGRKKGAS